MIHLAKQSQPLPLLWCVAFGAETTMVSPQQAAVITGVTVRTINSWVEDNLVHFIETADGLLLVCVSSLSQRRRVNFKQNT